MLPYNAHTRHSRGSMCSYGIAACPIGHIATLRPASLCRPNQQQLRTSNSTCTKSWNSNQHIIIPAMQWAAAHPLPGQTDAISPTAAGNISSGMPDGETVFNYRDGSDNSSSIITSRSNAGVVSVAAPPVPGQTDAATDNTDDRRKQGTQEESDRHVKKFNWNKVGCAVCCGHLVFQRHQLTSCTKALHSRLAWPTSSSAHLGTQEGLCNRVTHT